MLRCVHRQGVSESAVPEGRGGAGIHFHSCPNFTLGMSYGKNCAVSFTRCSLDDVMWPSYIICRASFFEPFKNWVIYQCCCQLEAWNTLRYRRCTQLCTYQQSTARTVGNGNLYRERRVGDASSLELLVRVQTAGVLPCPCLWCVGLCVCVLVYVCVCVWVTSAYTHLVLVCLTVVAIHFLASFYTRTY